MRRKIFKAISECIALLLSLVMLIPLYLIVINSFKDSDGANQLGLGLPGKWRILENYSTVLKVSNILTAYKSSILLSVISVVLVILFSSTAGFVLQRRKGRLFNSAYILILAGLTLPVFIVPTYYVVKFIGLSHTYIGVSLVYAALTLPFSVFLYVGYYNNIPVELDESAIIDGCGPYRLFFRIIFPLVSPITYTVLIIVFMSVWNDLVISLFLLNTPKKFTVVLTTYFFFGQHNSDWNLLFGDIVLISAPVVILYFALQKYIVSGLTAGAIKG